MTSPNFDKILRFLEEVPAIEGRVGHGANAEGAWWLKFTIDIEHALAWHVVQAVGHVLNYVSLDERLPTTFHPVSPPPDLNGGPRDFLSWVVECYDGEFTPDMCAEWLKSRLPDPVHDEQQWVDEDASEA